MRAISYHYTVTRTQPEETKKRSTVRPFRRRVRPSREVLIKNTHTRTHARAQHNGSVCRPPLTSPVSSKKSFGGSLRILFFLAHLRTPTSGASGRPCVRAKAHGWVPWTPAPPCPFLATTPTCKRGRAAAVAVRGRRTSWSRLGEDNDVYDDYGDDALVGTALRRPLSSGVNRRCGGLPSSGLEYRPRNGSSERASSLSWREK